MLDGRAAIVEERRAVIDEVADRQIAEQDLPAPHQVEEVIVGQEREAAVGVVEAQQPGEAEEQHGERNGGRGADGGPDAGPGRGDTVGVIATARR